MAQHRSLINTLYCRPGQWKIKKTPGELKSFVILLQIMARPLSLGKIRSQKIS
jgi:cellulose synthase (UDP-forming)